MMYIRKCCHVRFAVVLLALAFMLMLTSSFVLAQEPAPRVEIFGGYSWVNPGGRVAVVPGVAGANATNSPTIQLPDMPKGWDSSVTWNFNKWVGFTGDFGGHYQDQANLATILFGPKLAFRSEHFTPFAHVLVGLARLSPATVDTHNGFGAAAGGGLDMFFSRRFALRLIEVDYLFQSHPAKAIGGSGSFDGARLQGGLVIGLGSLKPPVPPAATCSVEPTAVLAGEPISATVKTQNFNPKHTLTYEWKGSGGKITGKDTTASVDTNGLAPGSYTVTATVSDPKGPKKANVASCTANFTINEPPKHPPTITCTANPPTVRSGDPSTITCQGNSPDNRPLTYTCQSTAGRISGNGPAFTLDTAGAPGGTITVNCTTTDDRGLSASTSTNVEVQPEEKKAPPVSKIGEIVFPNKAKPWRVDNTAKAILDDVALRLQREPDAKAVIVGYFDPKEKGGVKLAQQRAVNTKAYLTDEKGIDPARIEVRTGTAGGNRAEIYLVPAGASFDVQGTQTFDESTVKKAVEKTRAPAPKGGKKGKTAPAATPKS